MTETNTRAGGAVVPERTLVQADQVTVRGDGSHGNELHAGNVFGNFVFRPGGPAEKNVYNDFGLLEHDARLYRGYLTIQMDDTFLSPVVIPARPAGLGGGSWDFGSNMAELTAHIPVAGLGVGNVPMRVTLADGCTFTNLFQIGGYMLLTNLNTTRAVVVVPAGKGLLFTLGSGPQNNYPQIVNAGTQPFFDLTASGSFALIRMQSTITGSRPAFDLGGNAGPLQFSLYDSARVTANMITGTNPAATCVRFDFGSSHTFGQQPNFAGTITNGAPQLNFQQGSSPVTRDWVVPAAVRSLPIVPLTAPTTVGPGSLVVYDTTAGNIAQPLGKIRNPSPATGGQGQTDGTNYTGGQALKIKNAIGSNSVNVSPAAGDTIDYGAGPVAVGAGECLTFESDGVNNWLIVSAF